MVRITEEITDEFLKDFLQYGEKIEKMEKILETKGKALATEIESLEALEGESKKEGDFRILVECPMVPVLKDIEKANEELTGVKGLPGFYPEIVKEYINKHPEEGAILHPLCIVHQIIRGTFGKLNKTEVQQIACRSGATGKVVYSKNGMEKGKLTEEKAKELLDDNACLYLAVKEN